MTETKMTLKEMFNEIKKMANGEAITVTADEIADFCDERIALLNKKSTTASKKEDKAMKDLMDIIYNCLVGEAEPIQVKDLQMNHSEIAPTVYSNQKISSMLRKMTLDGRVTKTVVSGTSYFSV